MSLKIDELKLDIEELNKLLGSATRQRSRDVITLELQKLQIELAKQYESSNASSVKPRPSQNTGAKVYDVKLNNYCWDQSNKFVKLYITLNNVQNLTKESVACNFTNRSLDLRVLNLENRNYQLPINNLCEEIIPEESYVKVKNDMIVVFLAKKSQTNWSHVTNVEKKIKESKTTGFGDAMAPDSGDPGAGLMNVMKELYMSGDDEMKRTIAKAWTESQDKRTPPEYPGL